MPDNQSHEGREETGQTVDRRQLLQAVGAGISGLSLVGITSDTVTAAESGCARGPFTATHEVGSVDVGQIRADQARGKTPPTMGAASPRTTARDDSGHPPKQNAHDPHAEQAGSLSILTEYDGVNSLETRGGVPSDSQIAVGNGKIIHALNQQIAIYNKQAGQRQRLFRLERLWEPVIPEPSGGFAYGYPFVFDPRARYDRNADRFILCATQYEPGLTTSGELIEREDLEKAAMEGEPLAEAEISRPPRGWFVVAASATSNPNGEWYVYRIPPVDASGVDNAGLVDYPTLGFDRDAVYLSQNFFGQTKFEVTMATLDKSAMYAGEDVTTHHFDEMNDPDGPFTFTVQPAQQAYSGGRDGTFYMVNAGFDSDELTLWEVTNPTDVPSLDCFTIDASPYASPPPARQPESSSLIDTLGTRLMNADYSDGSLWTAHSIAVDWNGNGRPVAAIQWFEIDAASRTVVQSGLYGEPGKSYFIPTIRTNGEATVIAHNVSGPDTFPRMDVAGRTADYTAGELEDSVVVEEGKSKYDALPGDVERWGDYNGVSIDPSSGRFWTVSQYSPDIDIPVDQPERDPYFTRIAEVSFEDVSGHE